MPASFVWASGQETRPIEVTFKPSDPSWKVATQLAQLAGVEPESAEYPPYPYQPSLFESYCPSAKGFLKTVTLTTVTCATLTLYLLAKNRTWLAAPTICSKTVGQWLKFGR
mgnify:CR=1 FL=1